MILVFVTHGEAQPTDSRWRFRALTEHGRGEVARAAQRFLSIAEEVAPELTSKRIALDCILSSPLARCIETAVCFASAIRDLTDTPELCLTNVLREKRDGQLASADLQSLLEDLPFDATLLSTHGDLAGALPVSAKIASEYIDNGWFKDRPAIVVARYDRRGRWSESEVTFCEVLNKDGQWKNALL